MNWLLDRSRVLRLGTLNNDKGRAETIELDEAFNVCKLGKRSKVLGKDTMEFPDISLFLLQH